MFSQGNRSIIGTVALAAPLLGVLPTDAAAHNLQTRMAYVFNVNGVIEPPVVADTGVHRGNIAGVYGDTGIFILRESGCCLGYRAG